MRVSVLLIGRLHLFVLVLALGALAIAHLAIHALLAIAAATPSAPTAAARAASARGAVCIRAHRTCLTARLALRAGLAWNIRSSRFVAPRLLPSRIIATWFFAPAFVTAAIARP
jgi:hypothetical protein